MTTTTVAPIPSAIIQDYKLAQSKLKVPQTASTANTTSIGQVTPIAFNKDDVIENCEFKGFVCPISLEKFVNPVVDSCGHTFEKGAIRAYCKAVSKDGIHFPCPLDPSAVLDINQFVINYALKSAIEETEGTLEENKKIFPERFAVLEEKVEKQSKRITALESDLYDAKELTDKYKEMKRLRKIQLRNVEEMSLRDRFTFFLFQSSLESVRNRGLSDEDIIFLKRGVKQG